MDKLDIVDGISIIHGDCLEVMRDMEADSVDAIVTDPPYGLKFMGKDWDHGSPGVCFWKEAIRVAKPGAHLLAFGGTRTFHRLACAIEDAGFEIRDTIMWVYGSGFPKSLSVDKKIDEKFNVEREIVRKRTDGRGASPQKIINHGKGDTGIGHADGSKQVYNETAPTTELAKKWKGWGTALKPSVEPIIVARKPLIGTVAENVIKHGTGAINIDGCRISTDELTPRNNKPGPNGWKNSSGGYIEPSPLGRWPANFIHDGSKEVVELFPITTSGNFNGHRNLPKTKNTFGKFYIKDESEHVGDTGSAARFFYSAKASRSDRNQGCENREKAKTNDGRKIDADNAYQRGATLRANTHPTVKPTDLMRYLCRLITPPGGVVFDPFMGSGSTGKAAILEGFKFIGIEQESEYIEIARLRLEKALSQGQLELV